ncbi:Ig-like domain-containing protein [Paenibacillus eucommiae]|uniref:Uncharacterized protein YjdB n=1 Tax=Paenibacillus eucommiae TaxID=1355755 RepID=A0ABS4IZZ7_9BACL|nr:Ig-like domain-containing protein [Paenibacillus eucommiae]MBP1993120.1 uncharacterized protein YjdB [Paenibacillus eucommiae]
MPKLKLNIEDIDKTSVSSVKLDKKTITLSPGKSEQLRATVMPANAANLKVTWSRDNSQVAEVDASGNVTGKAPGFAKITVTTENGGFSDVSMGTVVPERAPASPDIAGHLTSAESTVARSLEAFRN